MNVAQAIRRLLPASVCRSASELGLAAAPGLDRPWGRAVSETRPTASRILHVSASLSRVGAGVAQAARELGMAQRRSRVHVHWACLQDAVLPEETCLYPEGAVSSFRTLGPLGFGYAPRFEAGVRSLLRRCSVAHIHGLWMYPCFAASAAALSMNVPFVVAPHGMLEPWALRRSHWRKQIVGSLWQKRGLRNASCLHAITPCELDSFRAYGLTNPIAVVPNGVDLHAFCGLQDRRERLAERFPSLRSRPVALFLSRVHPKKGLLLLMDAWAAVRRDFPDWALAVVGPDEDNHRSEVEKRVRALDIAHSVVFAGPLYGEDKLDALAGAEFFVLPSFSEGFSMAVLEAMASRLPTLITTECNFPEVANCGAGLIVEPNAERLAEGLRNLLGMSQAERAATGQSERQLVEERYTWDRVAAQSIEVYEWLLSGGPAPECVCC